MAPRKITWSHCDLYMFVEVVSTSQRLTIASTVWTRGEADMLPNLTIILFCSACRTAQSNSPIIIIKERTTTYFCSSQSYLNFTNKTYRACITNINNTEFWLLNWIIACGTEAQVMLPCSLVKNCSVVLQTTLSMRRKHIRQRQKTVALKGFSSLLRTTLEALEHFASTTPVD